MDAIPNPVRAVVELFSSDFADIRFGDVDAKTLSTLTAEVESAAEAVASAQAMLDGARAKLQERQETLLQQAQRALAYARVYAEPDAALSARLDAIALPRTARRARPEADVLTLSTEPPRRPRGRPRKTPATEPVLEGLAANAE